jgi:3-isopropylmalate/(R)-2-methylmalate dehydratase small subunit
MKPYTPFASAVVPIVRDHIDTDQIIPARFLKTTDCASVGVHLFADWRTDPQFPLLRSEMAGRRILLTGENFGCGSSREHAPWALTGWGFRAVIARSFADIFRGNALKNGLLPIVLESAVHARLCQAVERDPAVQVGVDLDSACVTLPGREVVSFPIDAFSQSMMLAGHDELGYLLGLEARIAGYEAQLPKPRPRQ